MGRKVQTAAIAAIAVAALALSGCGQRPARHPAAGPTPAAADLTDADPRLKRIAAQSGRLLPGGRPAFEARLRALHGIPVVANKWASWCHPCAAEAPIFRQVAGRLGDRVAFLGVDVFDSDRDALRFMREQAPPYPSYSDPRMRISQQFPPPGSPPVTNFYDTAGRLVHTEAGEISSAAELRALIARYLD
jgi:cytochrome c biogenesis protein CcmG/thiol:disulfide interchange protein DsbE